MTFFIQLRTRIQSFVSARQTIFEVIARFIVTFAALLICNATLGYQPLLNHWWAALLASILGAAVSIRATTIIILFYGLVHLVSLATDVAIVMIILVLLAYFICGYFRAKDAYLFVLTPAAYYLNIPFVAPMGVALFGDIAELASVIMGSIITFYLHIVSDNATLFLEENTEMTAMTLIQSKMLANPMFYVFVIAMSMVFVVAYYFRVSKLKYSWTIAVSASVATGFLIMLAGCLFAGSRSDVPGLVTGSLITFVIGVLMAYLCRGADYSRTEHVLFEDDEYFYYVTAVPKAHIPEQEKKVKKITGERK